MSFGSVPDDDQLVNCSMQAGPWTTCIEVTDLLSFLVGFCFLRLSLEGLLLKLLLKPKPTDAVGPVFGTRWACHWTTHLVLCDCSQPEAFLSSDSSHGAA